MLGKSTVYYKVGVYVYNLLNRESNYRFPHYTNIFTLIYLYNFFSSKSNNSFPHIVDTGHLQPLDLSLTVKHLFLKIYVTLKINRCVYHIMYVQLCIIFINKNTWIYLSSVSSPNGFPVMAYYCVTR